MFAWLAANIGTILITLALAAVVFGIIRKLINDKKHGISSCGGNCAHCKMCTSCQRKS